LNKGGVKNQNGMTIIIIIKRQIISEDKFLNFIFFCRKLYRGENINARRAPRIIDKRIGLKIRKDKIRRATNRTAVIIF
jgi:hypothetical protein